MSSVGAFRKVEMNLVYQLTQTDNTATYDKALAIDAGGNNLPRDLEPLFFCPASRIRFELQESKPKKDDEGVYFYEPLPFNSSPHFPGAIRGNQQATSLLDYVEDEMCKLPVVPLFWCNNKEPEDDEFRCGACHESMASTSYYACVECEKEFHKECVESPLEIRHPSHPFHSLQLYNYPDGVECTCCGTSLFNMLYHCSTCGLNMHPVCAMKPVPLVVDHPNSHPHPLTFFPTQASLICHICGLIKSFDPTYICVHCVFVIHKDCIGFPHVIRISRHNHRISFTFSLPSGTLSCGVCHQLVDDNYGAYACSKGESYFVHSRCALDRRVWDGKDLTEVPEEDDIIDDGEPFKRIADGIILHISHSHNLQLELIRAYEESKCCRGCATPIYQGKFYSCMESSCDFILHESCAHAPRMIRHPLHPHPLTLNFDTKRYYDLNEGFFHCTACWRMSSGFAYEQGTGDSLFQLDLRCAPITEPFQYQGHDHPLFLPLDPSESARCESCKYNGGGGAKLNCFVCNYIVCFNCAILPYKARYKHDNHFLTRCDGKDANHQQDWCEACETKIILEKETERGNRRKELHGFYKCNECCTALHITCLLGKDMYMKPGIPTTMIKGLECKVLLNSSLSRPICRTCNRRCPFPIVFKGLKTVFCASGCVRRLYGD